LAKVANFAHFVAEMRGGKTGKRHHIANFACENSQKNGG
jgi:hypothetical protein